MNILTPEQLREIIESIYPRFPEHWGQATDEIRDMCRNARESLGLDDSHAVNFREFKTPTMWNQLGTDGIIKFYNQMTDDQKVNFVENHKNFLGEGGDD
jgi:hypothetical protein